jgi:hypothetical protein
MGSEEEEGRIERLEQDAERETRSLEKDGEELGERIDEKRREWMRKHRDTRAPRRALSGRSRIRR